MISIKYLFKMNWDTYYKEQIIKSNNHTLNNITDFTGNYTLNKVSDFTENQSGGFLINDWFNDKLKRGILVTSYFQCTYAITITYKT